MGRRHGKRPVALLALCAFAVGCGPAASSTSTAASPPASASASVVAATFPEDCTVRSEATPAFAIADCTVNAPALAGNLLGDPATLDVVVWLPDDYDPNGPPRPTVYFLAGYGTDVPEAARTFAGALMASSAEAPGKPIVVMTDGRNALDGSFYVNSAVTGNWTDAIATDLVGFVDGAFRTIPEPAGRGISGHSMGGFGALWLAMHEPDVFGAVYALSPGLATPDGLDEALGEASGYAVRTLLDAEDELRDVPQDARAARLIELAERSGGAQFPLAYGAALAPDPDAPALMQIPFRRVGDAVERDPEVWAAWGAGFDDLAGKVETYGDALGSLSGIGVDWGTTDEIAWIPPGCAAFVAELRAADIDVVEATFPGGHVSDLGDRMTGFMLPFFAERLAPPG
jgi:S-formylglutathione hydrolase